MNSIISLVLLLSCFSSCSLFKRRENRNLRYVSGTSSQVEERAVIEEFLTKEVSMAGGNYTIFLLPLTKPLLFSRARESSLKTGINYKSILRQYLERYSENKTCFEIQLLIVETDKAHDISKWNFKLTLQKDISYSLAPVKIDAIVKSSIGRGFHHVPEWLAQGLYCSNQYIELKDGFGVHLKSNYVQWPFPEVATTRWVMPTLTSKKKSRAQGKSFQKYRGW